MNNIDLLMTQGHTFHSAVAMLEPLLKRHLANNVTKP